MDSQKPRVDPYNAGYDQQAGQPNVMMTQPQGCPPGYPGPPQQQVAGNTTVMVMQTSPTPVQSFVAHIAFACVVYWCCGWIFGSIAFIFALVGQDRANTGDAEGARAMGRASMGVSIAGLVIGIMLYIAIIVYYVVVVNKVVNDELNNVNNGNNDWNNGFNDAGSDWNN